MKMDEKFCLPIHFCLIYGFFDQREMEYVSIQYPT